MQRVEKALSANNANNALVQLHLQWERQIKALAQLVRRPLTRLKRAVLTALITLDVHSRDIIGALIEAKVGDAQNFNWRKQLRYYWEAAEEELYLDQTNGRFTYGYEYLGCTSRLVVTQLTDRCYITLTGALQLNLGGSPAGPAGAWISL